MITVRGIHTITDEKERLSVLACIKERETYYLTLFANAKRPPKITLTFGGTNPRTIRITFNPPDARYVAIDAQGYGDTTALTKYAFKKLRRVAKNYFVKNKRRHRPS